MEDTVAPVFLLRLPPELRQQIYSYLIDPEVVSHPLPGVGITSVSHRPPPSYLLYINAQLTADVLDYYYTISTWKMIFSHAFNFFRIDPDLSKLAEAQCLRKIQNVEIVFFCDILLVKEYPSFGVDKFTAEIKRRATRACEILATAPDLRQVRVGWIDTTNTGAWKEKSSAIEPLRMLKDKVTFTIGEVIGPEGEDERFFVGAMKEVLMP
ncbi:hypothetical protein M8818_006839 [Zalaria obscura]|uniref:Uncharacterized protein n=1 Tax=Zalaria obscura TaxID=2024903 RepID=A0ACC3S6X4_9PEZI